VFPGWVVGGCAVATGSTTGGGGGGGATGSCFTIAGCDAGGTAAGFVAAVVAAFTAPAGKVLGRGFIGWVVGAALAVMPLNTTDAI